MNCAGVLACVYAAVNRPFPGKLSPVGSFLFTPDFHTGVSLSKLPYVCSCCRSVEYFLVVAAAVITPLARATGPIGNFGWMLAARDLSLRVLFPPVVFKYLSARESTQKKRVVG